MMQFGLRLTTLMNMRTQANVGRRLLGAAAVAAFATAVLSGCVLAPVVSTVLEPEDNPADSAQHNSTPAMDGARAPRPSVKAELDQPDRAGAPDGASDDAASDEDSSGSREDSIFGPPRSSPPAPRVTVRIELPHES